MTFANFLLYALLLFNVTLRVFTNYFQVLPKIFNIADVFITAIFVVFFILAGGRILRFKNILHLLMGFNIVCLLGITLNLDYFYPLAALAQLVMYNEPIILFLVLVNLPFRMKTIRTFSALLFGLVIVELIIGILQVPLFITTGETEQIIGTFYGNAEQYGAFMLLGIFLFLARTTFSTQFRPIYFLMIILMFMIIILIDNKASWLGILVSVSFVVFQIIGKKKLLRYRLQFVVLLFALLGGGYWVAKSSKTFGKLVRVIEITIEGNITQIGKIQAYSDVFQSFENYPHMMLVGSGLGNFYSRSSYQFYDYDKYLKKVHINHRYLNKEEILDKKKIAFQNWRTNSLGGLIEKNKREPFYAQIYNEEKKILSIGSGQVDEPFSSYNALLGETGIFGLLLYLSIYGIIISFLLHRIPQYRSSTLVYPIAIVSLGMTINLLTVSIYGMWIDSGRMNTIIWAMTAIFFRYDYLNISIKINEKKIAFFT